MITALKRLGKSLFSEFGLEIRKKRERTPARASLKGALHQLSTLGFHPHSVIDVEAASETPDLYEAFPEARILLIEPLAEFEPFLQNNLRHLQSGLHPRGGGGPQLYDVVSQMKAYGFVAYDIYGCNYRPGPYGIRARARILPADSCLQHAGETARTVSCRKGQVSAQGGQAR